MPIPLPDDATIQVPSSLADVLLRAAETFRSTTIRTSIRPSSRRRSMIICGERRRRASTGLSARSAADSAATLLALVQGIRYDEGNRLFVGINRASASWWRGPTRSPELSSCTTSSPRRIGPLPTAGSSRPRSCIRIPPTGILRSS